MTQNSFVVPDEAIKLMGIVCHLEAIGCWYMAGIFRAHMDEVIRLALTESQPTKIAA